MATLRHVVCPHCMATNRVPDDQPAAEAKCGACHDRLFAGHPEPVDAAQFDKHRRSNDIPVLVDVWAPWCAPCRAMTPMFERAAADLEPDMRLVKLNADEAPQIAANWEYPAYRHSCCCAAARSSPEPPASWIRRGSWPGRDHNSQAGRRVEAGFAG